MNTYTKTFIICPHCDAHTNSSIDHFQKGESFGPWHCDECGRQFQGKANGKETQVSKVNGDFFSKTLDLLVLPPIDKPVYFVLEGKRYHDHLNDDYDGKQFFYEEHSCPTNWIRNTIMIANAGDTDPHGLLQFVRSIPAPTFSGNCMEDDEVIISNFPEVKD